MSNQNTNLKYSAIQRHVCSALIALIALQPLQVTLAGPGPTPAPPAASGLLELFDQPHLAGESIPPYVMITASKDQQLFKKAYDDYSDLDGDGALDTTYKHSIDYYGYFDAYKCYNYSDSNRRFEPVSVNTSKYCVGNWSGNFLNWSSMTRIDALRKVLFGGLRSPTRSGTGGDADGLSDGDTVDSTVLERTYLPHEAHAFTKYYDGSDLSQLTPFTGFNQTVKGISISSSDGSTDTAVNTNQHRVRVGTAVAFEVGDVAELRIDATSFIRGRVDQVGDSNANRWIELRSISAINIDGTASSGGEWNVQNISRRGITICNTTNGDTSGIQALSNTNTNLPRMKIARGNYSLWNASERWQCTWNQERGAANGNNFAASGIPAYPNNPSRDAWGLDETGKGAVSGQGSYFVRSQVCVDGLLGKERCKQYPNGKFKPVGLLQVFGETDRIRFGLLTGSYRNNLSGGVLRKNVGRIDNEINLFNGTFYDLPTAGVGNSPSPGDPSYDLSGGSIIKTLSLIKMTGYEYGNGTYFAGPSGDNCSYQRELNQNGACMSWGNPISEMYYEVLRYFGGQTTATAAYNSNTAEPIDGVVKATWPTSAGAVLSKRNYCAPLNALVINAATNTNEKNTSEEGSTAQDLSFMTGSPGTGVALTNKLGTQLGLSGNYYMGSRSGDAATSAGFNSCTGKTLTGLGNVYGLCPEGPTYGGSYHISGLALHAHTNQIRATVPNESGAAWSPGASAAKLKRPPLKMDTYAVSLSSGVPRIPIKFAADTEPRAILQPSYRLVTSTIMGGALVDSRILFQKEEANRSTGRMFVSFEDSEGGGDYDMDVWGIITYDLVRSFTGAVSLTVTTDAVYQATGNPQGFGYIIAGTDRDGQHFHSGIHGFTYTDATPGMAVTGDAGRINSTGGCSGCEVGDGPSTASYNLSTVPLAKTLEEPLYYTAIAGGFEDSNKNGKPDMVPASGTQPARPEWDRRNNSTGADTPDGIPDNYFKVSNPLGLEVGLERTFQLISEQTSLSAVSSSSTRVKAGNRIYEAKFNSGDWSGELESRVTNANGQLGAVEWTASSGLATNSLNPDSRKIFTVAQDTKVGIPFRWSSVTPVQKAILDRLPSGVVDSRGEERLEYLRGSGAKEGLASGDFRARLQTKLGDIVDSNPLFVGRPSAGFADVSYGVFARTARTPMIYVGANDGMLHGFDATNGTEKMAFIPSQMFRNLSELTSQDYKHKFFVNGQLAQQDVKIGADWKTYLVGGLGKGGQGVFALDVTNPSTFSEGSAANIVKWEFTDQDDAELGYVYAEPVIRKMPNGKWAALISSGYNATEPDGNASTTGKAHLFVLFLEGPTGSNKTWVEGTDYVKIPMGAVDLAMPNGLGGIGTWDTEGDGVVDYAYAGDLKGNMWRVKFAGTTPTGWTTSSNVLQFFIAQAGGLAQPITAAPLITQGPGYTGALVVFGTGKLLEKKDINVTTTTNPYVPNSFYGVLDRFSASQTTVPIGKLVKQQILDSETASGTVFSLLTSFIPNYTSSDRANPRFGSQPLATGPTSLSQPEMGWRLNLPNSSNTGERSFYSPVQSGSLVVFSNAIPSAIPCDGGGSEARYALDIFTGGRARNGGFDRNSDDAINAADMSSFSYSGSGGSPPSKFYSSRRENPGGYGQVTILAQGTTNGGGAGETTLSNASCNRALAYSSVGDQPDRLPGGCASRIQWREALLN
jgi:type IV pilus assembly protein PilY1